MEKKYCDICKKEMEEKIGFWRQRFALYGLWVTSVSKDFCSKKCLIKFVETEL